MTIEEHLACARSAPLQSQKSLFGYSIYVSRFKSLADFFIDLTVICEPNNC